MWGHMSPSHPGATAVGEGRPWGNPDVIPPQFLTRGTDLGARLLTGMPCALAALGRGSVRALLGSAGRQLWLHLGKVLMAKPSFSEMISRQGGETLVPTGACRTFGGWQVTGADLPLLCRAGGCERCWTKFPCGVSCMEIGAGWVPCGTISISKDAERCSSAGPRAAVARGAIFFLKTKSSGCCSPASGWLSCGLAARGLCGPMRPCAWDGNAGAAGSALLAWGSACFWWWEMEIIVLPIISGLPVDTWSHCFPCGSVGVGLWALGLFACSSDGFDRGFVPGRRGLRNFREKFFHICCVALELLVSEIQTGTITEEESLTFHVVIRSRHVSVLWCFLSLLKSVTKKIQKTKNSQTIFDLNFSNML